MSQSQADSRPDSKYSNKIIESKNSEEDIEEDFNDKSLLYHNKTMNSGRTNHIKSPTQNNLFPKSDLSRDLEDEEINEIDISDPRLHAADLNGNSYL